MEQEQQVGQIMKREQGIDLFKSEFSQVTSFFEDNIIEFENHKRKYILDMKLRDIQNNHILQQIIPFLSDFAQLLQKKDNNMDKQLLQVSRYNNLSALEYLIMKCTNQIEKQKKKKNLDEGNDKVINEMVQNKSNIEEQEEEICCICQCELYDKVQDLTLDQFQSQIQNFSKDLDVIQLHRCDGHFFHFACLQSMIQHSHIKCPICSQIYGTMKGDQPDGNMSHQINQNIRCSGYNCGTIVITYQIYGGVKNGKSHPGTSRIAYLPDNKEGREVFELLKTAFERRLIFTVGRSVTTGQDNVVVWNGIHHKTSTTGGSSYFGYPDPTYFDRVKQELALKGVV